MCTALKAEALQAAEFAHVESQSIINGISVKVKVHRCDVDAATLRLSAHPLAVSIPVGKAQAWSESAVGTIATWSTSGGEESKEDES